MPYKINVKYRRYYPNTCDPPKLSTSCEDSFGLKGSAYFQVVTIWQSHTVIIDCWSQAHMHMHLHIFLSLDETPSFHARIYHQVGGIFEP